MSQQNQGNDAAQTAVAQTTGEAHQNGHSWYAVHPCVLTGPRLTNARLKK